MTTALEQKQMIEPWGAHPFARAPARRDQPASCAHCIHHRIADAVETWAQISMPADRAAAWSIISDLLNLKNMPPAASGMEKDT